MYFACMQVSEVANWSQNSAHSWKEHVFDGKSLATWMDPYFHLLRVQLI